MASDAEVEILIKAVDNVSSTLDKIERRLGDSSKQMVKSTEKVTQSFNDQIGTLIALGNIASQVDAIFSAYTNMQLRVENSTLRVTNAQERLEDSQTKINRLARDGKQGSDEYQDALKEQERAVRNLQISQNNLARTNNAVIGTYINMSVQSLGVVSSLAKMAGGFDALGFASLGLVITLAPLIAAIGAIALISGGSKGASESTMSYYESVGRLKKSQDDSIPTMQLYTDTMDGQVKVMWKAVEGIKGINDAFSTSTEETRNLFGRAGTAFGDIPMMGKPTNNGVDIQYPSGYNPNSGITVNGKPSSSTASNSTQAPIDITIPAYDPGGVGPSKRGDFVQRPGQPATNFSSDDTIIGVKNPGGLGVTVYIENIYGVSASDISRALAKELNNKMSI